MIAARDVSCIGVEADHQVPGVTAATLEADHELTEMALVAALQDGADEEETVLEAVGEATRATVVTIVQ